MNVPALFKIKQSFDNTSIEDAAGAVAGELSKLCLDIAPGARIAITAGSRGIDRIPLVIRAAADHIKSLGGEPFIVPAMGSHGGATAEGQIRILKELGITEESAGAPILSSMETVVIGSIDISQCSGRAGERMDIHMDRHAFEADGILVVNRVKPHTSFRSSVESGMLKMMAIGLGKEVQARNIHSHGTRGLRELLAPAARMALSSGKVLAAVGIVENARDRIRDVEAFLPGDIEAGEAKLLQKAKANMPKLPLDKLDVLIIEEIGKNISGTGMDTNIVGRLKIEGEPEPDSPRIGRIVVLGLSRGTGGNAYGMGLADYTTQKLVNSIDYKSTYANVIATTFVERAKIPVIAGDEEEAVALALQTCGVQDVSKAKVVRIKNTLCLEEIEVSQSVLDEMGGQPSGG